jgi:hypothetical protein
MDGGIERSGRWWNSEEHLTKEVYYRAMDYGYGGVAKNSIY